MQGELEFKEQGLLGRQWSAFHLENPQVWALFEKFGLEALRLQDRERFSARAVWNRMRWHVAFETTDEMWKLNNNHCAFYGRLFMVVHDCDKFFEVRSSEADDINYQVMVRQMKHG